MGTRTSSNIVDMKQFYFINILKVQTSNFSVKMDASGRLCISGNALYCLSSKAATISSKGEPFFFEKTGAVSLEVV